MPEDPRQAGRLGAGGTAPRSRWVALAALLAVGALLGVQGRPIWDALLGRGAGAAHLEREEAAPEASGEQPAPTGAPRLEGRGKGPPASVVALAQEAPSAREVAAVVGRVVDPQGRGVGEADVSVHLDPSPVEAWGSGRLGVRAMLLGLEGHAGARVAVECEPDGTFRFEAVPCGPLWLLATAPGWAGAQLRVVHTASAAPAPVLLGLEAGRTVLGRVVDEAGRGVVGAQVRLAYGMYSLGLEGARGPLVERAIAPTDEHGRFELRHLPEGGLANVVVSAPGYAPRRAQVEADADEVEVRLEAGVAIEVAVTAAEDGRAVPGAVVLVLTAAPEGSDAMPEAALGVTDSGGRAALRAGSGAFQGVMLQRGQEPAAYWWPGEPEGDLIAPAGQPWPPPGGLLALRLRALGRVRGRVTDAAGSGLAGIEVRLVGFLVEGRVLTTSAADGGFALPLQRGRHDMFSQVLFLRGPGWVPAEVPVPRVDPASGEATLSVALEREGCVRGRVVDPEGRPLAGARIGGLRVLGNGTLVPGWADGPDYGRKPVLSARDGTFVVDALSAQNVQIVARAPDFTDGVSGAVVVRPGATAEVGEVRVGRGFPLLVRAVGASDQPLADALVSVRPLEGGLVFADRVQPGGETEEAPWRWTCADRRGEARVTGLPVGLTRVEVRAAGHVSLVTAAVVTAAGEAQVVARLEAAAVLAGRVLDSDGAPVVGAQVSVRVEAPPAPEVSGLPAQAPLAGGGKACGGPEPVQTSLGVPEAHTAPPGRRTGALGAFRFERLVAGPARLQVRQPGFRPLTLSLTAPREGLVVRLVRHVLTAEQEERLRALEAEAADLQRRAEAQGPDADAAWERLQAVVDALKPLREGEPLEQVDGTR